MICSVLRVTEPLDLRNSKYRYLSVLNTEYCQESKLSTLVTFRYMFDMFFIIVDVLSLCNSDSLSDGQ